jgi:outer membrane protein OmpA-like peptidoglycan-associated protein
LRASAGIVFACVALCALHAFAAPAVEPPACDPVYVFFQPGEAVLAPQELSTISSGAKTLLAGKLSAVVVGHTDGQEGDDKALSERRAVAVKRELVRQGVDAETLQTSGRGMSEPLTPAAPGIAESFNRYVIIDFCGFDRFSK